MIRCQKCQAETPVDAVYCPNCGARLDMQDRQQEAVPPADEHGAAKGPQAEDRASADLGEALQPPPGSRQDTVEEDLWEGGFSSRAMIGTWIVCALVSVLAVIVVVAWLGGGSGAWIALLIGLVVLWGSQYARFLYRRMGVHYRLTNHRFFHERGILKRTTDRIEVIDMDDITFEQGIVERMCQVGSILITSSDRTDPQLKLEGIADVSEVAEKFDAARRAERMRRGLHIESI